MTTTEDILAALNGERALHVDAGRPVEVARIDQEITAHLALARLHTDQSELHLAGESEAAAALDPLIAYWRRQVTADTDQPSTAAGLAGEPGPEPAGLPPGGTVAPATRSRRGR
ncbi:hypothetical protein ACGFI9_21960 [Micromonospora sp. NPDC048930]|uniref:hypothetical protein n=1 Tax=Micromonospora sp. NPDC048930 TaxID=3364261 RepID=UPI003711FECA